MSDAGRVGALPQPRPVRPAATPVDVATRAAELGLRVHVTRVSDQKNVILTDEQLRDLAQDPARLARYGINTDDVGDFFRAIELGNSRGVQGARINLTHNQRNPNPATSRIYDGIANNVPVSAQVALIQPQRTEVATGLGNSFDVRGPGAQTRDIGTFEALYDAVGEHTVGLLFDYDSGKEQRESSVRDNAASIAMVGGSQLRAEIAAPVAAADATSRLEAIVRRANPEVSADTVRDTARLLYDELSSIYAEPTMTPQRLDTLRSAVNRAGAGAFAGNSGAWLRERLTPAQATSHVRDDVTAATSAAELHAVLALNVTGFDSAPVGQQTRLSNQLHRQIAALGADGQTALKNVFAAGANVSQLTAVTAVMGHAQFGGLSDTGQAGILRYAHRHHAHMPAVNSMLQHGGRVGRNNGPAFVDAVHRVDPSVAAEVIELNGLVAHADFAALTPATRRQLLAASEPGHSADLSQLVQDAQFKAFSAEQQAGVATAIAQMGNPQAATLIQGVRSGSFTGAHAQELVAVATSPDLATLPSADRQRVMRAAVDGAEHAGMGQALAQLIGDRAFQKLPAAAQTTLVSQAENYPNPVTAANLRRLANADWFRAPHGRSRVSGGMTVHQHQQRTAAMVAYTSATVHVQQSLPSPTTDQQESTRILSNSLDQFLPTISPTTGRVSQGRYHVNWRGYSSPPGTLIWGSAQGRVLSLNQTFVPASDGPVPGGAPRASPPRTPFNETDTEHVLLNTMVHEVNHLMNGDRVAPTFEYFMGEYGAWYSGFVAAYGRQPTRQEAYSRARFLLTRTTGAYRFLNRARQGTRGRGGPDTEAHQIINFMAQFYPAAATPGASPPTTAAGIVATPHVPITPGGTAPRPPPGQNRIMDNAGTPRGPRSNGFDVGELLQYVTPK